MIFLRNTIISYRHVIQVNYLQSESNVNPVLSIYFDSYYVMQPSSCTNWTENVILVYLDK